MEAEYDYDDDSWQAAVGRLMKLPALDASESGEKQGVKRTVHWDDASDEDQPPKVCGPRKKAKAPVEEASTSEYPKIIELWFEAPHSGRIKKNMIQSEPYEIPMLQEPTFDPPEFVKKGVIRLPPQAPESGLDPSHVGAPGPRFPVELADRPRVMSVELCKLWILGGHLSDSTFQNAVIDHHLQQGEQQNALGAELLQGGVLERTSKDSGLREWILDHVAAHATFARLETYGGYGTLLGADYAVVFALLKRVAALREEGKGVGEGVPRYEARCKYHEHPAGVEKCT